jgi:nucleoside-specific outer membrane channel protein Tsx
MGLHTHLTTHLYIKLSIELQSKKEIVNRTQKNLYKHKINFMVCIVFQNQK